MHLLIKRARLVAGPCILLAAVAVSVIQPVAAAKSTAYAWDADLAALHSRKPPVSIVAATHNGWPNAGKPGDDTRPQSAEEFARYWRCDFTERKGVLTIWEKQWALPHPGDVPSGGSTRCGRKG